MTLIKTIIKTVLPKAIYERIWRHFNWKHSSDRFEEAIQSFVIEKGLTDPIDVNRWKKKLVKAFVKDNWNPDEYFFFNYERLSKKGIYEFVPNREATKFWEALNSRAIYGLTRDKGQTYQYFKPFFQRDIVAVYNNGASHDEFMSFMSKHPQFIVKPIFGNLGNGVQVVDTNDVGQKDEFASELLLTYTEGFIAEELIIQCDEMASFHPYSVNTLRLTTVRQSDGKIYIIHRPFVRFGQGGRVVDNGGNGGIFGAIDFETGIIKATIDERMNSYVKHPDTGKVILGYQIPRWEEAKAFVVNLANVIPELRYCGWDIALTDEGWVMVEANGKGLFIGFQMPTQEGFRDEFEEIKIKCGYNDKLISSQWR